LVIPSISVLSVILFPIGKFSKVITQGFLYMLGIEASQEPFVSEDELKLVLSGAAKSGSLMMEENEMIASVLELEDMPVRDIMTPLVDVVAIDESQTLSDMKELWLTHQYSRVPLYRERIDNIVGVMYCYDLLKVSPGSDLSTMPITEMQKQVEESTPYFVPESMSVWNLLKEFRSRKSHMAVVVNEYGGVVGIATLEDCVEEIVGEIYDETDKEVDTNKNIVYRGNGVFDVDAKTDIDDVIEAMGLDFPEGGYETVGGYAASVFGCIPQLLQSRTVQVPAYVPDSEYVRTSYDDPPEERTVRVTVTGGDARQIGSLRFEVLPMELASVAPIPNLGALSFLRQEDPVLQEGLKEEAEGGGEPATERKSESVVYGRNDNGTPSPNSGVEPTSN